MNYGLLALVAIGCAAMAALVWFVWFPADLRRILKARPEHWPKRNAGGGYDWPDGSTSRDQDGVDVIVRKR